ncbi:hypothetical protein Patl1_37391 [Pistacia atlantica]|nr:hypothetical protein Patl1_37391 [Pistacia atlantica]
MSVCMCQEKKMAEKIMLKLNEVETLQKLNAVADQKKKKNGIEVVFKREY